MKAILEFNLPEDASEYAAANAGAGLRSVLWDFDQWLRQQLKYGHEFASADEALEAARKELRDDLQGEALDLDALCQ